MRWTGDCLIFIMGIPLLARHLYIETTPDLQNVIPIYQQPIRIQSRFIDSTVPADGLAPFMMKVRTSRMGLSVWWLCTLVSLIVKCVWLLTQWKKIPGVLLFVAIDIVQNMCSTIRFSTISSFQVFIYLGMFYYLGQRVISYGTSGCHCDNLWCHRWLWGHPSHTSSLFYFIQLMHIPTKFSTGMEIQYHDRHSTLTHWGLVMPFGDIDLGQHWLR